MNKEWYVVNTYSGHENKVKEKLLMRASTMGLEDYIFRVVVPEEKVIDEKGKENIYKIILDGMRDPEISYNVDTLDPYGNVIEITDQTRPAYQFDKLKEANKGNILGAFVAELEQYPENSMEHQVLCEGVRALMETRRG